MIYSLNLVVFLSFIQSTGQFHSEQSQFVANSKLRARFCRSAQTCPKGDRFGLSLEIWKLTWVVITVGIIAMLASFSLISTQSSLCNISCVSMLL